MSSVSENLHVPNFPQRTIFNHASITINYDFQNKNMYQIMNPILQNEVLVFPQKPMVDAIVVTNHSDQSEGFVSQQPREPLTAFNREGNQSVEPNEKHLEQESLRNLDATRRHETTEIIAFKEQMDRNATTKNQSTTIGQAVTEIQEGLSANQTTHAKRRSLGNHLRTSLLHLKKQLGWYNHRLNEGKTRFKENGKWFPGKSCLDVDENDIIVGIGLFHEKKL